MENGSWVIDSRINTISFIVIGNYTFQAIFVPERSTILHVGETDVCVEIEDLLCEILGATVIPTTTLL